MKKNQVEVVLPSLNKTEAMQFKLFIEQIDGEGQDLLDAVVGYAEKHNIEIETIATIIKQTPTLKKRLLKTAYNLNFLKEPEDDAV